jgi:hypothetical protein
MRRVWFVVVILIAVIGGLNSMSSSRRSAADEQAMRDRSKSEVKAELQAELTASRPAPAPTAPPSQPTTSQQVVMVSDSQRHSSHFQRTSVQTTDQAAPGAKEVMLARYRELNSRLQGADAMTGIVILNEMKELQKDLADIEMAERGASPQTIAATRQRRVEDDMQQTMEDQSRQMRQMQWDMEQQRQQLEEQRRETERLQEAENHRKWYGE